MQEKRTREDSPAASHARTVGRAWSQNDAGTVLSPVETSWSETLPADTPHKNLPLSQI
jgi:hypothetical protein